LPTCVLISLETLFQGISDWVGCPVEALGILPVSGSVRLPRYRQRDRRISWHFLILAHSQAMHNLGVALGFGVRGV